MRTAAARTGTDRPHTGDASASQALFSKGVSTTAEQIFFEKALHLARKLTFLALFEKSALRVLTKRVQRMLYPEAILEPVRAGNPVLAGIGIRMRGGGTRPLPPRCCPNGIGPLPR